MVCSLNCSAANGSIPRRAGGCPGGAERSIGTFSLATFGVGATVGTGTFFGLSAAAPKSVPAVVISLVVAGIAAGPAALCRAEPASGIPVSGYAGFQPPQALSAARFGDDPRLPNLPAVILIACARSCGSAVPANPRCRRVSGGERGDGRHQAVGAGGPCCRGGGHVVDLLGDSGAAVRPDPHPAGRPGPRWNLRHETLRHWTLRHCWPDPVGARTSPRPRGARWWWFRRPRVGQGRSPRKANQPTATMVVVPAGLASARDGVRGRRISRPSRWVRRCRG